MFVTSKHLKYLKRTLESKKEFSYSELYLVSGNERNERRYASLKQDTKFFKNLCYVQDTVFEVKTEDEWHIKLDLKRIPQEVADFMVAYTWMCPGRWFNYDWRKYNRCCGMRPYNVSDYEWNAWCLVDSRFKKITKDHLPICTVDNFIEYDMTICCCMRI